MKRVITVNAKLRGLLIFGLLVVLAVAGGNYITQRLKDRNTQLVGLSQSIQMWVTKSLLLEERSLKVNDEELLKNIEQTNGHIKEALAEAEQLTDRPEYRELITELATKQEEHKDLFARLNASHQEMVKNRNAYELSNHELVKEILALAESITQADSVAMMTGQDMPATVLALRDQAKNFLVNYNGLASNFQALLVSMDMKAYLEARKPAMVPVQQTLDNLQGILKLDDVKDYEDKIQSILDRINQGLESEKAAVQYWRESQDLSVQMAQVVNQVQTTAATLAERTGQLAAYYAKMGITITLAVLICGALIFLVVGNFFVRSVILPIKSISAGMRDIAEGEGDLTKRLEIKTMDELGQLSHWFNTFIEKIHTIIKNASNSASRLNDSSDHLAQISEQMANGANDTLVRTGGVSESSTSMSEHMNSIAVAMEEASTNISVVASSTEEMTATINEISQNTDKARNITIEAVSQAEGASKQVDELGSSAQGIGKVLETISEISEQVNLLALNATIEAARAGEAGKGFAVVANEIKELAKQTADATEEIRSRVEGIQSSTHGTVTQIGSIRQVVNEVNEIVVTIASAIEEQSVTTKDIASNVAQASEGIGEVNENVARSNDTASTIAEELTEVTHAIDEMSNSSNQVNVSAEDLSSLSGTLDNMVKQFKI